MSHQEAASDSHLPIVQSGASIRALVCGDVNGQLSLLESKLNLANQRQGPFSFVLCCGNFFGDSSHLDPALLRPINPSENKTGQSNESDQDDSKFISGECLRRHHPNGLQLAPSLEFLGGFGFRQICGLVLGYLCGRYDPTVFFNELEDEESIDLETTTEDEQKIDGGSMTKEKKYFGGLRSAYYCRSVLQRFKDIGLPHIGKTDIFISSEWPTGTDESLNKEQKQQLISLFELGQTTSKDMNTSSANSSMSPALSELIELFEPRFHLAAGCGVFYQRPMYRTSEKGLASRFIGLGRLPPAHLASTDKRLKFLHALILKPMAGLPEQAILAVPSSCTQSPYFNLYNPNATPVPSESQTRDPPDSPTRSKRSRSTPSRDYHEHDSDATPRHSSCPNEGLPRSRNDQSWSDPKRQRISEPTMSSNSLAVLQDLLLHRNNSHPPLFGPSEESMPSSSSVYIMNIPYQLDANNFMDVMKSFGSIVNYQFPLTPDGKSSGRAWVTYESVSSAEQAVAASDQLESGGRLLKIQFSHAQYPGRQRDENGQFRNNQDGRTQRRVSQAIDVRPHSDCWFCLANPNCEKRLIVSIGEKIYVALAKGGMVHQHVLVIPVTHWPNFVFCPPDVGVELENYIAALRRCYRSQGMEAIVYERYFPMRATTGMHMQLQVIPIPSKCAARSLEVFQTRAERSGVPLVVLQPDETISALRRLVSDPINQAYFYVELPGAEQVERCLYVTRPGDNKNTLPFNLGREAIAALMDVPHRADWKRCVEPEAIETRLAQQMQKLFSPFQPR